MIFLLLALSLVLQTSNAATTILSLTRPSLHNNSSALANLTRPPNGGSPPPAPKKPFTLKNLYVYPPVQVTFTRYGDHIPQSVAKACVLEALNYALDTREHSPLARVDAGVLVYAQDDVRLNFYPENVIIWEEWKNALYLVLEFVQRFEAGDFRFEAEIRLKWDWVAVGRGFLGNF